MKFPKPWYRKSRGAWFVTLDGRQIQLGEKKKEALVRYKELLKEPRKRTIQADSLLAVIDAFLEWCHKHRAPDTYEWYRYRLERFARRYPDLRTDELRPYLVQEWLDGFELSKTSKRNYGSAVKRCLRWAKKLGYIDTNPIEDLDLPRAGKKEQVVSETEFETILDFFGDHPIRDLLHVTWDTGCRPQESLRVEGRHVDLANQRWVFSESESKTDIPRVIYLTDRALAITKRHMLRYPAGPLFRNSAGRPWTTDAVNCAFTRLQIKLGRDILEEQFQPNEGDKRRKYATVNDEEAKEFAKTLSPARRNGTKKTTSELMHEARKKLTNRKAIRLSPRYSLYALRHTWMNRMLTKGVDSLTVAFLAGHADPSTLAKVYAHLSQNPSYLLEQAKRAAS